MSNSGSHTPTTSAVASAANILAGMQNFAATGGPTTVIQVPAGRTWIGTVSIQCAVKVSATGVAAAVATGIASVAGAGAAPAAGDYLRADAMLAANTATGTAGTNGAASNASPFVVIAPAGNPVQITATATVTGTGGEVNVSAVGQLL